MWIYGGCHQRNPYEPVSKLHITRVYGVSGILLPGLLGFIQSRSLNSGYYSCGVIGSAEGSHGYLGCGGGLQAKGT